MEFDAKGKSLVNESSPSLLHKIRLITPEDPEIFQAVSRAYALIDDKSNIKERAYCSVVASILLQERLYFALSKRSIMALVKSDPNLGPYTTFDSNAYSKLLAAFYNQFGLFDLIKPSTKNNAAAYRLKDPVIAEYLLNLGVDGAAQKEETLEFCSRKFRVVTK